MLDSCGRWRSLKLLITQHSALSGQIRAKMPQKIFKTFNNDILTDIWFLTETYNRNISVKDPVHFVIREFWSTSVVSRTFYK